jgi:hypothetical protein
MDDEIEQSFLLDIHSRSLPNVARPFAIFILPERAGFDARDFIVIVVEEAKRDVPYRSGPRTVQIVNKELVGAVLQKAQKVLDDAAIQFTRIDLNGHERHAATLDLLPVGIGLLAGSMQENDGSIIRFLQPIESLKQGTLPGRRVFARSVETGDAHGERRGRRFLRLLGRIKLLRRIGFWRLGGTRLRRGGQQKHGWRPRGHRGHKGRHSRWWRALWDWPDIRLPTIPNSIGRGIRCARRWRYIRWGHGKLACRP